MLDLFNEKNKQIFQSLVSKKITEENLNEVKLEVRQKIFVFEQKLSILLKKNSFTLTVSSKKNSFKFDLVVFPSMTEKQLAKEICQVCQTKILITTLVQNFLEIQREQGYEQNS